MTLTQLRQSKHLTKKEMANIIGRTVPTYSKRELHPRTLKVREVARIYNKLKLTEKELNSLLEDIH